MEFRTYRSGGFAVIAGGIEAVDTKRRTSDRQPPECAIRGYSAVWSLVAVWSVVVVGDGGDGGTFRSPFDRSVGRSEATYNKQRRDIGEINRETDKEDWERLIDHRSSAKWL